MFVFSYMKNMPLWLAVSQKKQLKLLEFVKEKEKKEKSVVCITVQYTLMVGILSCSWWWITQGRSHSGVKGDNNCINMVYGALNDLEVMLLYFYGLWPTNLFSKKSDFYFILVFGLASINHFERLPKISIKVFVSLWNIVTQLQKVRAAIGNLPIFEHLST